MMKDGRLKLIRAKIRDFLILQNVEITPEGDLLVITGANAQGKSSILKALRAAIEGIDPEAIREGSDSAEIHIDLGRINVHRYRTPEVEDLAVEDDGVALKKREAKALLRSIFGRGTLDPLEWTLLGGGDEKGRTERLRRQRNVLLEALDVNLPPDEIAEAVTALGDEAADAFDGLPVEFDPDKDHPTMICEVLEKAAYDARYVANQNAAKAEKLIAGVPAPEAGAPAEDVMTLRTKESDAERAYHRAMGVEEGRQGALQRARRLEDKIDAEIKAVEELHGSLTSMEVLKQKTAEASEKVADFSAEIDRLEEQLRRAREFERVARRDLDEAEEELRDQERKQSAIEESEERMEEWRAEVNEIEDTLDGAADVEGLREAYERAAQNRQLREEQDAHDAAVAEYQAHVAESESFGALVDLFRNVLPARLLEKANLPIKGLGVKDGIIVIDGIPIHNLGTGEQIKIGVQVAAAINPGAGFVCVDRAECLDREARQALGDAAKQAGVQLLMTVVDDEAKPGPGRIVMEEGKVRG